MVNFGILAAEIVSLVFGTQANVNGFRVLAALAYCTELQYWASAKFCGVEQRAPPILGRASITLGIGQVFLLFSSPNLSRRRLYIFHASVMVWP